MPRKNGSEAEAVAAGRLVPGVPLPDPPPVPGEAAVPGVPSVPPKPGDPASPAPVVSPKVPSVEPSER